MFKWFTGKNRRILGIIIVIFLVLAMVIPLCASVAGY